MFFIKLFFCMCSFGFYCLFIMLIVNKNHKYVFHPKIYRFVQSSLCIVRQLVSYILHKRLAEILSLKSEKLLDLFRFALLFHQDISLSQTYFPLSFFRFLPAKCASTIHHGSTTSVPVFTSYRTILTTTSRNVKLCL